MTPTMPFEQRFWAKVDRRGPDDCWSWLAGKDQDGYGYFWVGNGRRLCRAHRVAYELLIGSIPKGLELDHLCRNPPCVNPAHLEPVTTRENIRRGVRAGVVVALRTSCYKGHPYTPENTYGVGPDRRWRVCRTCRAADLRLMRLRRKTA